MTNPPNRSDRFTWKPGDIVLPQCLNCRWLTETLVTNQLGIDLPTCAAWPFGIPDGIFQGVFKHDESLPDIPEPAFSFSPINPAQGTAGWTFSEMRKLAAADTRDP